MAKTLLMRPQVMASLCTSGRSHLFSGSRALPCFIVRTKAHRLAPRLLLPEKLILGRRAGGGCGNRLEDGFFVGRRSFCTRASTQVNDSGAIDPPLMQSMEKKIKEHLNAESVVVKDAYGDGRHVSIDVISSAFEGESAVNRQRMVYKAIWEELQTTVHAVDQMTTKTPIEAGIEK